MRVVGFAGPLAGGAYGGDPAFQPPIHEKRSKSHELDVPGLRPGLAAGAVLR